MLGVASLLLAIGGLYLLGSAGQTSRFAGLIQMLASGGAAWWGKRIRYRTVDPKLSTSREGQYILIVFALAGILGFLVPLRQGRLLSLRIPHVDESIGTDVIESCLQSRLGAQQSAHLVTPKGGISYSQAHCVLNARELAMHFWKVRHGHHEPAYVAMLRLAGALATFSLEARPENLPDYDRNDL